MQRILVRAVCACAVALPAAATAPAAADAATSKLPAALARSYQAKYKEVRRRHGVRAPGRNIVRDGVLTKWGTKRPAWRWEVRKSVQQLKVLLTVPKPAKLVRVAAVDPQQPPSGVQTASVAPDTGGYAMPPSYISDCESGGDPTAVNPTSGASGKWQFLDSTWTAITGLPGPASAYSEAAQDAAAARLYANGAGASNWACA